MEIVGNLPQELSWNIMKYNSHPSADIIRPFMKIHPTAKLMHQAITDSSNWHNWDEEVDGKIYLAMILLFEGMHCKEYYNEKFEIYYSQPILTRKRSRRSLDIFLGYSE